MVEEKVPNRWVMVVAAVVMQLCLGILYAYSVVRGPLSKECGYTVQQTGYPYMASLFFFALGMIVAGRWQDKAGPRTVAIVGGVLLAIGAAVAGMAYTSLPGLVFGYGVLGGLGVGFAYVTPIATCIKWFPDKRGTVTGLAVFGFGAGTLVFGPLLSKLIATAASRPPSTRWRRSCSSSSAAPARSSGSRRRAGSPRAGTRRRRRRARRSSRRTTSRARSSGTRRSGSSGSSTSSGPRRGS